MRAASSVIAGMFGVEPIIDWLPRLSPHMVGSAFSDHYLGGRVARPLNGLPHEPFLDPHRTVGAPHIDRLRNIRHRVDANASFVDDRLWTSDVPSRRFTWSVRTYITTIIPKLVSRLTYDHLFTASEQMLIPASSSAFATLHGHRPSFCTIGASRYETLSSRCFREPDACSYVEVATSNRATSSCQVECPADSIILRTRNKFNCSTFIV